MQRNIISLFLLLTLLSIVFCIEEDCPTKPSTKLSCVPDLDTIRCTLEEYDTIAEVLFLNSQKSYEVRALETVSIPLEVNSPRIKWRTKRHNCKNWTDWSQTRHLPFFQVSGLRYLAGPNDIQFRREKGNVEIFFYTEGDSKVFNLDDRKDSVKISTEPGTTYSFQFKNCNPNTNECSELSNYFKITTPLGKPIKAYTEENRNRTVNEIKSFKMKKCSRDKIRILSIGAIAHGKSTLVTTLRSIIAGAFSPGHAMAGSSQGTYTKQVKNIDLPDVDNIEFVDIFGYEFGEGDLFKAIYKLQIQGYIPENTTVTRARECGTNKLPKETYEEALLRCFPEKELNRAIDVVLFLLEHQTLENKANLKELSQLFQYIHELQIPFVPVVTKLETLFAEEKGVKNFSNFQSEPRVLQRLEDIYQEMGEIFSPEAVFAFPAYVTALKFQTTNYAKDIQALQLLETAIMLGKDYHETVIGCINEVPCYYYKANGKCLITVDELETKLTTICPESVILYLSLFALGWVIIRGITSLCRCKRQKVGREEREKKTQKKASEALSLKENSKHVRKEKPQPEPESESESKPELERKMPRTEEEKYIPLIREVKNEIPEKVQDHHDSDESEEEPRSRESLDSYHILTQFARLHANPGK